MAHLHTMTPQPRGLFVTRHLPASASPPTFNSSQCAHYAKVGQYFSDAGSRHAANGGDILLMFSDGSYALVHSVLAGAHSAFFRRFVVEDRVPAALDLSGLPQCEAIRLAVRYMYEGYVHADAALRDDLQFIARLWEIDGLQELLQNEPSNSDQAFSCSPHFARQFMRAAQTSKHVKANHTEFPTTAAVRRSSETAVDVPPNQSELPKKASFNDHKVDDARRTPQEDSLYDIRNIPDLFVNDAKQTAPPEPLSMGNSEHSQRTDIGGARRPFHDLSLMELSDVRSVWESSSNNRLKTPSAKVATSSCSLQWSPPRSIACRSASPDMADRFCYSSPALSRTSTNDVLSLAELRHDFPTTRSVGKTTETSAAGSSTESSTTESTTSSSCSTAVSICASGNEGQY